MFGTLRAGSLLYILNKGEEPNLKVGQVLSVTPPRPKVNSTMMPLNPMQMEQVIDINVKVGDIRQGPIHLDYLLNDRPIFSGNSGHDFQIHLLCIAAHDHFSSIFLTYSNLT